MFILIFFQVYVVEFINIVDYCSIYVLSDSKEDYFKGICSYLYDQYCMQCEILKEVFESIEICFVYCGINGEEFDDLMYFCC